MVTAIQLTGTPLADSLVNDAGNCRFLASAYSIRPPLYIPLLQPESAAVSTTKLMIPAAATIPILAKVSTKGLPAVPMPFQGKMVTMTKMAPT
ncbi:hypothetical protein D3C79_803930 [compost metagenome]